MSTQVFLTTTGTNTWTVPADWNSSSNTIEVIGAGGGGGGNHGGGGGGGGYAKITNLTLTPSSSVSYTIAVGGTGIQGNPGTAAGDTYFNGASLGAASVGASGGAGGLQGTAAGGTGSGSGATTFSGGTGAYGATTFEGGGGGAAGPNGAGGNGTTNPDTGGTGDNGSGGAGGTTGPANAGNGNEYGGGFGSGGGGGGQVNGLSASGTYGGGGGGNSGNAKGGDGQQGLIVITYNSTDPRYWVGGTGTWDASDTTHWSASSGGSGGASVPNLVTSAIHFDANSGGGTVTLGANFSGVQADFTGFTGTFNQSNKTLTFSGNLTMDSTWQGSGTDTIGGNFTLTSGMTTSYTGALVFNSTTTSKTIDIGAAVGSIASLTFNGVGGGWVFQSATSGTTVTTLVVTNGSVNLNNFNHSFFSASNTGTLVMGTGTLSLIGTGTVFTGGGTITPGTSTISITDASSTGKTFAGGGKTYNNLRLTGAGTGAFTISGSNTFNDFRCDTPPHTINFTAGTTQTLNTFTVNGTAGNLMTLQSTSAGNSWFLVKSPAGTVSCDYLSLQDSHVS